MAWQNRFQVSKAEWVGGEPIPHDEPVLVIRGQDVLAMRIMNEYIHAYEAMAKHNPDVMMRLQAHREELVKWQARNPDRMKVAD